VKTEEHLTSWKEHFEEILNQPPPTNQPILQPGEELLIRTDVVSNAEIKAVVFCNPIWQRLGRKNLVHADITGKGVVSKETVALRR